MKGWLPALCGAVMLLGGCVYSRSRRVPAYEGSAPYRVGASPVSIEDVIHLSRVGISEDIILSKVRSDGVAAKPTADQIVTMKKEGVSERVIEAVVAAPVPAPPEPPPPRVVYRYAVAPWWGWDPWWCGWPYPWWGFHYYWRYRH